MVTYELKLMRRMSITKNDSTTNSVPRVTQGRRWMRRIFETALEPSHGFRSNCPWYGKNEMERQKNDSMRRRESSIDRSILAYFDLERSDSLVWEPPFPHYSSPLKRLIISITFLNVRLRGAIWKGVYLSCSAFHSTIQIEKESLPNDQVIMRLKKDASLAVWNMD